MAGKACSFHFEFRVVPRPDPAADADRVRRILAGYLARYIAAELQARDNSPTAQPQVGNDGAEAGEDRKAAGPAAAARTPDAAPGSVATAPIQKRTRRARSNGSNRTPSSGPTGPRGGE